ncbi:hypothetical protein Tco_0201454 [Tanacetum coccineum]
MNSPPAKAFCGIVDECVLAAEGGLYVCMPEIGKGKAGAELLERSGDFEKAHELFQGICSKRLIPDGVTHATTIDG